MFLLAANVDRPSIAPGVAVRSGAKLAEWATRLSKPLVVTASSSPLFENHCLRRKWCVLVLSATGRLESAERAAIQTIAGGTRAVRCVTVDSSKLALSLDLPGGMPQTAPGKSTVMLLKTVESSAEGSEEKEHSSAVMTLASGLVDERATLAAIKGAIDAASAAPNPADALPKGFTKLEKKPSVRLRQPRQESCTPKEKPPSVSLPCLFHTGLSLS